MKKICLKGGRAVIDDSLLDADICIENGIIAAVGNSETFGLSENDEIIDCRGKILMPGVIDAHCHIQLDTGIFATCDDWFSGSREAAQGGITAVIDFVGPQPGEDLMHALDFRCRQAQSAIIDYTFHMTALDASENTLKSIAQCPGRGISSLKLYTTYRPNYYLDDMSILKILEAAESAGMITLIHCENDAIVSAETSKHAGEDILRAYPDLRPAVAEAEAAQRMIRLAQYAGAQIVIAHNSCAETAKIVAEARLRGTRVFNETAPQYLWLSGDDNKQSKEPWRYILQPPLRGAADCNALKEAVLFGDVDMIITDHCAYKKTQKTASKTSVPGGLPGFRTLLPMSAAVPGMTWPKLARLLSRNPAKIYGLWPRKGAIAPGFDADIVILRDETFAVDESKLDSFAQYSPFHGRIGRGIVETVLRRGEIIVSSGMPCAPQGSGKFIAAKVRKCNDAAPTMN